MQAVVLGNSPVRLWGLTPAERVARQLRKEGVAVCQGNAPALPPESMLLVLRGDCLYDDRVIRGLVGAPRVVLEVDDAGVAFPAAAHVSARDAPAVGEYLRGGRLSPDAKDVSKVALAQLAQGFESGLRKLDRPYVLRVTAERREELEQLAFSGAYKGVTDLVTKWLWPAPAQMVTRWCVRWGIRASVPR